MGKNTNYKVVGNFLQPYLKPLRLVARPVGQDDPWDNSFVKDLVDDPRSVIQGVQVAVEYTDDAIIAVDSFRNISMNN